MAGGGSFRKRKAIGGMWAPQLRSSAIRAAEERGVFWGVLYMLELGLGSV